MMKPKRWNKRRRSGMNIPRGTRISNMGSSKGYFMDTRNNSLIPTLRKLWSIPLPMLSPMGGLTLKMMSIRSIGWMTSAVYLRLCLTKKYRISWLGTFKVRNVIWVKGLLSWNNHRLKNMKAIQSIFHPDKLHSHWHLPK